MESVITNVKNVKTKSKYESNSSNLGRCLHCGPFDNWESKSTPDAPEKSCDTCKHYTCSLSEEPCKSCNVILHPKWEPKDAEKQTDWGDDSCGHLLK